nr:phospho-N-acetylmuramoyl-pentapeptide-transferase [Liquorilactobacillus satsumensis]
MSILKMAIATLISFVATVSFLPLFINYAHKKKQGQMIREVGPKWHEKKAGTPTMGGLVFNGGNSFDSTDFATFLASADFTIAGFGFHFAALWRTGFWDDSIKLWKKQNEGMKAWQKLLGQIIGALIFMVVYTHEKLPASLSFMGFEVHLGLLFTLFVIVWLVGFSNAVNLTDGIDGLVAGQAMIAFGVYAVIAHAQHKVDILLFCLAVIGALAGFLIFNHKPAKIFMGDMGSLSLGGALAAVSILLHQELSLLLVGIIFVIETASVMLQVASFKLTGKRIFKMSPIHHHFELSGWSEWRIDLTFWLIGLIAGILTLWNVL